MLDEYSKHLELLQPESIAEYVSEDADPVEKARVSVAGIVTALTTKNTKNGERMAFFTVEDRMAEIECIAFARQYADSAHLIRLDAALLVGGTLSLREDEPPKILVNRLEPLVENSRFRPEDVKRTASTQPAPQKPAGEAPKPHPKAEPFTARRLFLRVPDARCTLYFKALNLAELFEGSFPTYFFFADEKRYDTPMGVAVSDYVLRELRELLGDDNVILK